MHADDAHRETLLAQLRATAASSRRRVLLTGATVVTMHADLGVLPAGDVLLEGDTVAAVGPDLPAGDAIVIDVTGAILTPGFVETHRHAWRPSCAGSCPTSTTSADR